MTRSAIHHDALKQHNVTQILLEIRRRRELVKSDLVRVMNLSFATVSSICDLLEQQNFINMDRRAESTGGRRAKKILFNPRARFIAAVDLSVKGLFTVTLADLDFSGACTAQLDSPDGEEFAAAVSRIREAIGSLCRKHGIAPDTLIGAGLAIPGLYDGASDTIHFCSKPAFNRTGVRQELEAALGLPVEIVNDANAAALGQSISSADAYPNLIFIYFSEGVGLGIIHQGRVFTGAHGLAGEVGKIGYPAPSGFLRFEQCINFEMILKQYRWLKSDDAAAELEAFICACSSGEAEAGRVLDFTAGMIGWGLTSLIDLFDPGCIFIGGNIEPMLPYLLPRIRVSIETYSVLTRIRSLPIEPARVDNQILAGTGEQVLQRWLDDAPFVQVTNTK